MNELVIFNYSLKRAINSSFKCFELAVRERAHVLIPSRWANGMVSNGHVTSLQPLLFILLLLILLI